MKADQDREAARILTGSADLASIVVILVVGLASPVFGQMASTSADSVAIMSTIANWERAWEIHDAELAAQDYTDDADWTNAFGMRRIGRDSIRALLTDVFQLPFVMAGRTEYQSHDLRFLTPEVALLRSRSVRTGQQLPNGQVQKPRLINHLRVYVKRNGIWKIVSHLIADERALGEPRNPPVPR